MRYPMDYETVTKRLYRNSYEVKAQCPVRARTALPRPRLLLHPRASHSPLDHRTCARLHPDLMPIDSTS